MKVYVSVWFESQQQSVDLSPVEMDTDIVRQITEKAKDKLGDDLLYAYSEEEDSCYLNIPCERISDFRQCVNESVLGGVT